MSRVLRGLLLLLVVGGIAWAADRPAPLATLERFEQQLDTLQRSEALKDRAWAAYLRATHGTLAETKDDATWVRRFSLDLRARARSKKDEDVLLVRAILDAFIQRRVGPDPEVLARCLLHHPNEAIVLCAQDPARYEKVLDAALAPGLHLPAWMAVANLLRARKTRGAMFRVMRGAYCVLDVSVLVDKNSAIGVGGGSRYAPRTPKELRGKTRWRGADWPPSACYAITDAVEPGRVVLAGGSHPVLYERREFHDGTRSDYTATITRNTFRYHVLADAMGWPFHEMRVSQAVHKTIYWEGEKDYVQKVAEKRYFLRLFWDGEIDGIAREGFLTKAEAAELELDVKIQSGWRGWSKYQLPDVPEGILEQEKERRKRKRDLTR